MEFLSTTSAKALKPYVCVMCGGAIPKGDIHLKKFVANGYTSKPIETWRIHIGCKHRSKAQAWETIK